MSDSVPRRAFIQSSVATAAAAAYGIRGAHSKRPPSAAAPYPSFPRQDPALVEEMVRVSHFNLARVKELVDAHPAIARATVDWGFGDWEDALGAAAHTGHYDIAEVLLAHGARPTIFSAAMMGELDTVKAFISTQPGSQRILGPHGITLLAHAKIGGQRAQATCAYLEALGDADPKPPTVALDQSAARAYPGRYAFGDGADEYLDVVADKSGLLTIQRPNLPFARPIFHLGNHDFFPMGADAVRIRFAVEGDRATSLTIVDRDVLAIARRTGAS
jgi:hypothetical protein